MDEYSLIAEMLLALLVHLSLPGWLMERKVGWVVCEACDGKGHAACVSTGEYDRCGSCRGLGFLRMN